MLNKQIDISKALLDAIKHNKREETVKCLLEKGALTTQIDEDKHGCLHWAVRNRCLDIIKLLMAHEADATAENKKNQTPMDLAVESGHWDCVLAIAKGLTKKNNPKDKARCGSALLTAIQENQPEKTIESLLKAGASTACWVYPNGEGCLHWAVRNRRLDIIKLLMAHEANAC
jgi:ankyrin repeat protein